MIKKAKNNEEKMMECLKSLPFSLTFEIIEYCDSCQADFQIGRKGELQYRYEKINFSEYIKILFGYFGRDSTKSIYLILRNLKFTRHRRDVFSDTDIEGLGKFDIFKYLPRKQLMELSLEGDAFCEKYCLIESPENLKFSSSIRKISFVSCDFTRSQYEDLFRIFHSLETIEFVIEKYSVFMESYDSSRGKSTTLFDTYLRNLKSIYFYINESSEVELINSLISYPSKIQKLGIEYSGKIQNYSNLKRLNKIQPQIKEVWSNRFTDESMKYIRRLKKIFLVPEDKWDEGFALPLYCIFLLLKKSKCLENFKCAIRMIYEKDGKTVSDIEKQGFKRWGIFENKKLRILDFELKNEIHNMDFIINCKDLEVLNLERCEDGNSPLINIFENENENLRNSVNLKTLKISNFKGRYPCLEFLRKASSRLTNLRHIKFTILGSIDEELEVLKFLCSRKEFPKLRYLEIRISYKPENRYAIRGFDEPGINVLDESKFKKIFGVQYFTQTDPRIIFLSLMYIQVSPKTQELLKSYFCNLKEYFNRFVDCSESYIAPRVDTNWVRENNI